MRNSILLFCLLFSTGIFGQDQKNTKSNKVTLGFGFNIGLESLDSMIAHEVGMASTGMTLIDFRGRLNLFKFLNLDAGLSVSNFKDELPFTEAVVFTSGQLAGLPSTGTSEIVSGSFYYSIGARLPITSKLYLNGNVGQRRFSASRKVTDCVDCKKTDIDISAGTFIRTGLSWMPPNTDGTPQGEIDLLYSYYFDDPFNYTLSLGFLVYF